MSKQIFLSIEKKKEIAKTFKVSRQTVWYALNFKTNSGVANMLRASALQRGGVLVNGDGDFEPNLKFDTYWTQAPKKQMVQVFSPRVNMVADIAIEKITIEVDGEVVKTFGNVPMKELYIIQAEAQEIVNNLK